MGVALEDWAGVAWDDMDDAIGIEGLHIANEAT